MVDAIDKKTRKRLRGSMGSRVSRRVGTKSRLYARVDKNGVPMRKIKPSTRLKQLIKKELVKRASTEK